MFYIFVVHLIETVIFPVYQIVVLVNMLNHILVFIDRAKSDNSEINCTHPTGMRQTGAIHIGMETIGASLSYLNVVFDPMKDSDCAFGFGVTSGAFPKCSYCNVLNCEIKSSYGIVYVKGGTIELDRIYIDSSSGLLIFFRSSSTITFKKSWFCKGIEINAGVTNTDVLTKTPNSLSPFDCSFMFNMNYLSCQKSNLSLSLFLPAFVFMKK